MLAAAFNALRDMFTPSLRRVLLKSIGLALLFVVLIGIALQRLFSWLATSGAAQTPQPPGELRRIQSPERTAPHPL